MNIASMAVVRGWPVRNWRIWSISRTRDRVSPTRRTSKNLNGMRTRCENSLEPSKTSMRLVVCDSSQDFSRFSVPSNTISNSMPVASTSSVLMLLWLSTLSMMTCENSGVPTANSWITNTASSTSPSVRRNFHSTGTNQPRPNRRGVSSRVMGRLTSITSPSHNALSSSWFRILGSR